MTILNRLNHLLTHQWPLKLLSILIASSMWILVFGSKTVEITKEVPFEVVLGPNQVLVEAPPEKIVFKMLGPKAFLRTLSNRTDDPIRANLKNLKTGVFTHRIFGDAIKLPMGVKIQSITPNVVQLRVEELKQKWVQVRAEVIGEVSPGLKLLRSEVLPGQIRVKGPKNRLQNLDRLNSLPIDLSQIRETTIAPLAFDFTSLGIEPDSPLPEMNIEIQGKGQAYRVRHVPLVVKATRKFVVDEKEVTVIVRTDPYANIKLEGDQVKAEVDLTDQPSGEHLKWIQVDLPDGVSLVRVIPSMVRVELKSRE